MSPSAVPLSTTRDCFDDDLGLSIVGIGVEYPPYRVGPDALETLARRFYPDSVALRKVLSINRYTGIDTRASVGNVEHPLVNQPNAPTIKELNTFFMQEGVRLSVDACKKAVHEWGGDVQDITHVVSTTCTNSANPGFDHYVCRDLGIKSNVEKILLHGIGCSGGLAAIRTACNLALASSYRRKPARVLVLACEISTLLLRSELDSIHENQETRIGVCLFSDCASSCVISNGIGEPAASGAVYDVLGWKHEVLADCDKDLGFDVDPLGNYEDHQLLLQALTAAGWKVVLTPRVPSLATACVPPAFRELLESIPAYQDRQDRLAANDFDWALHPGGSTIITGIQRAMDLTDENLRACYEVYIEYGNSSSATVMSVLDKLRKTASKKEDVVSCAFGPGILVEMMIMKRRHFSDGATSTIDFD